MEGQVTLHNHYYRTLERCNGVFHTLLALLSTNYDNILLNWSQLPLQPNVVFDAGNSMYSMAAEKAGLKNGDVVLKVNGNSIEHIKSSKDAQKYLFGKVGKKVCFTVKRNEQIITFEVVREPLPK